LADLQQMYQNIEKNDFKISENKKIIYTQIDHFHKTLNQISKSVLKKNLVLLAEYEDINNNSEKQQAQAYNLLKFESDKLTKRMNDTTNEENE
jgi:hypothetical protein